MSDPIYYHDVEQGSEEWNSLRLGQLTASKFGDSITPTRKAAHETQVNTLAAERWGGCVNSTRPTGPMIRGSYWEDAARDLYATLQGISVSTCGYVESTSIKGFGFSPDGLVGDDGLLEIKCPQPEKFLKWLRGVGVPKEHKHQMLAGILCTGRSWCDFAAFIPSHTDIETLEEEDKPLLGKFSVPDGTNMFIRRYTPSAMELQEAERGAISFLKEVEEAYSLVKPTQEEF